MNERSWFAAFILILVYSLGASTAWAQTATTSLFGKWRVDVQKSREATKAKYPDARLPVQRNIDVKFDINRELELTAQFRIDGSERVIEKLGRWEVLREERSLLRVEATQLDGSGKPLPEKKRMEIRIVDPNTLWVYEVDAEQVDVLTRLTR